MTIKNEQLNYVGDGINMLATLYTDIDVAGQRPGILLFPEAFGPGPNIHKRAQRLAEFGYAAMVCDLHGGTKLFERLPDVMPLLEDLRPNPDRIRARATGALQLLQDHIMVDNERIAAIGFCFGGTMALELARGGAPIKGVVGFHSGLATAAPQDAKHIKGKILVCIGADDPGIPPEQRVAFEAEMREGGVDWMMHLYGGVVHSFTNVDASALGMPDFARYDEQADRRSWDAMMALFGDVFA